MNPSLSRAIAAIARRKALVAALAALALGAITATLYGGETRFHDEDEYLSLARTLASSGVFGHAPDAPTAFFPPGYPFFLAALTLIWDSVIFLQLVQIALWAGAAFMASALAERLGGPAAGVGALILALIYPTAAFAAATLYPQTLLSTLFLGALLILLRPGAGSLTLAETLGASALLTALALINPVALAFAVAAPPLAVWVRGARWGRAAALLALPLAGAALWMLRNHLVLDTGAAMATNMGLNLLFGNSGQTAPNLGVNVDIATYRQAAAGLGEAEKNRFYRDAALAWIQANPGAALQLYFGKFLNYFNFENRLATTGQGSGARSIALFLAYYGVLALVALRLAISRRAKLSRAEISLLILYLGAGLVYSLFFNRIRFRIPFDYMLFVLAGVAVGWLTQRVGRASPR